MKAPQRNPDGVTPPTSSVVFVTTTTRASGLIGWDKKRLSGLENASHDSVNPYLPFNVVARSSLDSDTAVYDGNGGGKRESDWSMRSTTASSSSSSSSSYQSFPYCAGPKRSSKDTAHTLRSRFDPADRGMLAHLVSLVAAFEKGVLPACAAMEQVNETLQVDHTFAIPVVVSLWDHLPPNSKENLLRSGACKWTREAICATLNATHEGFGDAFTAQSEPFVSCFGAHWDNIELVAETNDGDSEATAGIDSEDHTASVEVGCRMCEAKREMFEECVIKAEEESAERHKQVRRDKIQELRDADYDEEQIDREMWWYESDDSSDEDDDAIVDRMLQSGDSRDSRFPPPFPSKKEATLSLHDLETMLKERYGHTESCEAFSRPLKGFLLTHCCSTTTMASPGRIEYKWVTQHAYSKPSPGARVVATELVAGVTPSGFLCGAFMINIVHCL